MGLDLCYEKSILIFHIEKIALFFVFEVQKMVFHSLDLNPSGPIGKERRPSSNEGSATSAGSSVASGGSNSNKKRHRNSQSGIKSLVEYTSEVSSEDFSGPEDGEVDSDGPPGAYKKSELQNLQKIRRTPPPIPRTPPLVANASPINDDEDIDLGEFYIHVQISN